MIDITYEEAYQEASSALGEQSVENRILIRRIREKDAEIAELKAQLLLDELAHGEPVDHVEGPPT